MASYLLLRSNKQSGPYTLDDLCALGLKPYDLIWAEGKSAAWRYPSEIDELKDFAPAVEEQPYDRFYKKNSGEKHYHETVTEVKPQVNYTEPLLVTTASKEETIKAVPLFEEKQEAQKKTEAPVIVMQTRPIEQILKPIEPDDEKPATKQTELPKKLKVFVSLPNQKTPVAADQHSTPVQTIPVQTIPVQTAPVQTERIIQTKVVETSPVIAPMQETPVEKHQLREEYSRPLDEIKKMYVETYLNDKKKRSDRKKRLFTYARFAAAAAFIIVLGTFVYSAIRMDNNSPDPLIADQKAQSTKEVPKLNSTKKVVTNPQKEVANEQSTDFSDGTAENDKPVIKPKPKAQQPIEQQENTVMEDEQVTSEEMSTSDARPSRITPKPVNLSQQVSVKANDYKRKAFGGIHGLQLTVHNDSKYLIDKVMVELQYLKPSEQPLKSEIYYFNSIAPNGSLTIKIPDNPRGIKVNYKITHIVSNQYDQDIAGL